MTNSCHHRKHCTEVTAGFSSEMSPYQLAFSLFITIPSKAEKTPQPTQQGEFIITNIPRNKQHLLLRRQWKARGCFRSFLKAKEEQH